MRDYQKKIQHVEKSEKYQKFGEKFDFFFQNSNRIQSFEKILNLFYGHYNPQKAFKYQKSSKNTVFEKIGKILCYKCLSISSNYLTKNLIWVKKK